VIVSSRTPRAGVLIVALMVFLDAGRPAAADPALRLKASGVGGARVSLTIELFRWSTDIERAPLVTALTAPSPAPAAPAAPAGGRGGRGGRGGAPPPSPMARLTTAVKAAPTVGFIWGAGPTGYSIKYAWRSASADGQERLVLVTDRRLGAHVLPAPSIPGPAGDLEFTVIEARINGQGAGEARTSLAASVVVDAAAKTLALDGYDAAPVHLKVSR